MWWSLIRRPAGSVAELSSATIRNPTFTPDIEDLYVFRLCATNAQGQIAIRTLPFICGPPPVPLTLKTHLLETNRLAALILQGPSSPQCTLLVSTNLIDWQALYSVSLANGSNELHESTQQMSRRFYQLRIEDE